MNNQSTTKKIRTKIKRKQKKRIKRKNEVQVCRPVENFKLVSIKKKKTNSIKR
jgi:hypothetical protein